MENRYPDVNVLKKYAVEHGMPEFEFNILLNRSKEKNDDQQTFKSKLMKMFQDYPEQDPSWCEN